MADIKIDNEEIMINCPDGFDARTFFFNTQALFSWNHQKTSNKLSFLDE